LTPLQHWVDYQKSDTNGCEAKTSVKPLAEIEKRIFDGYLEYFHNAEERRRWNIQKDIPWEETAPANNETVATIVETFMAVEMYLPDYTAKMMQLIRRSRGRAWFHANWGYEESKHSLVLSEWLVRSGARTEEQLKAFEHEVLAEEWALPFDHPRQMIIYTMIQELATWLNYRNLKEFAAQTGDKALDRALRYLMSDERAHHNFFTKGVKIFMEFQPRETIDDLKHVLHNFAMPAKYEIQDYAERARMIAQAGIYGPRDYLKKVRDPVLAVLGLTKEDLRAAPDDPIVATFEDDGLPGVPVDENGRPKLLVSSYGVGAPVPVLAVP
jgi:acyl-[acyl-carrier-protein] desaturase